MFRSSAGRSSVAEQISDDGRLEPSDLAKLADKLRSFERLLGKLDLQIGNERDEPTQDHPQPLAAVL